MKKNILIDKLHYRPLNVLSSEYVMFFLQSRTTYAQTNKTEPLLVGWGLMALSAQIGHIVPWRKLVC